MCDTDHTLLNKSAPHLLPIQEGSDLIAAGIGNATSIATNLMTTTSPSSNSIDAIQGICTAQKQQQQLQQHGTPLPILLDDITAENYWLHEKMKEITADRDRLLCEVANLRLELDMAELKRIPEDRYVFIYT